MQHSYDIDLYEYEFLLTDVLGAMSREQYAAQAPLLKTALDFCNDGFLEAGKIGDREGCALRPDSTVQTPSVFTEWHGRFKRTFSATINEDARRTHVHPAIRYAALELLMGANGAYMTYFGFNTASVEMIERYGGVEIADVMVEQLRTMNWSSCLCVTEENAGSDLSFITTRAEKVKGNVYQVMGRKRLISAGMHDLAENIVWFVLAATEPQAGNAGLSCIAVPRYWLEADGTLSDNHVRSVDLPDKMGFRGCANPTLDFSSGGLTRGYLLGKTEGAGLLQLLTLMIQARVSTGIYALGMAARAYREALVYARQRRQGRSFEKTMNWRAPALPIIQHPDVQRMLLSMKSRLDGARALILELGRLQALEADLIRQKVDPERSARLGRQIKLFTPLIKAYISDQAWRVSEYAIQVLGGNGYLKNHTVEQCARDVKILSIWEGTNYIQSQYLVRDVLGLGRSDKIVADIGDLFADVLNRAPVGSEIDRMRSAFAEAWGVWKNCVARIAEHVERDRLNEIPKVSVRMLEMTAQLFMSWLHIRLADAALSRLSSADGGERSAFYSGKLQSAKFWFSSFLPEFEASAKVILDSDAIWIDCSKALVF